MGSKLAYGAAGIRNSERQSVSLRPQRLQPADGKVVQRLKDPGPTPDSHFWFTSSWTRTFTGTVGGFQINMTLTRAGDAVTGSYGYIGRKGRLSLSGQISKENGMATVTETEGAGKTTGARPAFVLAPNTENQLLGGWKDGTAELPVQLDTAPLKGTDSVPAPEPLLQPPVAYAL